MIGEEETIEVELDDGELLSDGQKAKAEEKKPETVAKTDSVSVADDIAPEVKDSLNRQLEAIKAERDAERQARMKSDLEARKLAQEAERAKQSADQSYYQLVDGYVHQAKSRSDQIKRDIKLALDAGEYERVSELQMEAAKVAARQMQYEDAKSDIEAKIKREAEKPKIERTIDHTDPFEAQISTLSEPSKQWLRQHKECVMDEVASAKVVLGDKMARRQGLVPDSKEYFDFIEEHMGYRVKPQRQEQALQEDNGEDVVVIADAKPVKKPMVSAPVSRDGGHQGKPQNGKVYLRKDEVEIAESLGMSPSEYAKWKTKVEQDGRYTN